MRHVRQTLLIIVVVMAMYYVPDVLVMRLWRAFPTIGYDGSLWLARLLGFVGAALAGALLMTQITWRFRMLAMLAIPVIVLLVIPVIAYLRVQEILQGNASYLAMWPYYVYLGIPVAGMIAGALLVGWIARRRATDPESAGTP